MNINQEKKEIINCSGNILVTANPGTGKTLLLSYKYVNLIKKGIKPDQILCLTFTRKARKEMEDRITKILYDENIKVDSSDLYIHTFHSFALDTIEEADLVSTNLLRYSIYRYLKDHNTLNYSDGYLLATIVPKMENLIRYLKSFGITADMINVEHVKSFITDFKKYTKEELERFLEEFVQIFQYYEQVKGSVGLDYSDMLIDFLKQNNTLSFQYVLVDELQDVNKMEADIALDSAETFIAVGDQKQAIFGFQGGSILNFEKFKDSTSFVLSENFRSTNAILDYARDYFCLKTKEKHHIKELAHLRNKKAYFGTKPIIYDVSKEEIYPAVSRLAKAFSKKNKQVAIIARTNTQISNISKELELRNIDHSSTFFSASNEAQTSIISFLKGVLSNNIDYIKEAMFTPFFPISLQEAFRLSEKKYLSLSEIYTACPNFKTLKKRMGNLEDVNQLFRQKIIPISISYGEEYLLAALAIKDAFQEAMKVIDHKTIENLSAFLQSTDLLASESNIEENIVLTTVHKSKGKQFDTVIYVPTKTQNRANFQDAVVKAILQSKKVNAEEELEEETLRVNFVAFTRAKKELYVITDQTKEYQTNSVTVKDLTGDEIEGELESEQQKRAFTLFVNKDYDSAKKLLEQKHEWIKDFIKNHFEHLDSLSFSAITTDAYDYLKQRILRLGQSSEALTVGSDVHQIAEHMIEGEQYQVKEEYEPYETNIKKLIEEIHEEYPEDFLVEKNISVSLKELINHETPIKFTGKLDAVFKNNDQYLIVDWKTSKNPNYGSSHRRQLAAYKKAFSIKYNIPLENINVAIGYVGLKKTINDGTIRTMLDKKQPSTTAVNTFEKHVQTILTWKNNIDLFFKELEQTKQDDVLLRSILEQYQKEKN
jgi:DNA helicase II / ATP-dependent DNA helicase PcrA